MLSASEQGLLVSLGCGEPWIAVDAWVAPTATLAGRVLLGSHASVWYGATLRADQDAISIGMRSNVQDGCVLHTDPGHPVSVGCDVSVGHRAILHGCVVEDGVLVGMGAVLMNGAVIGTGSIIAAGSVVLEGTHVPPSSLVAGVPGKVRRPTTDDERSGTLDNASSYVDLARKHAAGLAKGRA
ncbi:gamma carbonic anhydrase family protein [Kribbella sp. NPDC050124]|uniref:gamma carbonic anhydrase family protein n=1 Tax=Kribbella sp. NPDC050124 TaxID=3364114 RepID=UPI00378AA44D